MVCKFFGSFQGCDFGPLRLINTDGIKDARELVTVLCIVNLGGIRAEDINAALLELKRNVLGELTC